jgi:antitoxin component of MazEF toxin-antitoxin module
MLKEYHGDTDRLLEELNMRRNAKIRRAGNALAVTLPKKWLRELAWREGDSLLLHLDKSRGTITLQKPRLQEK